MIEHLNESQRNYLQWINAQPPEKRCYCGWYLLGECPHCPANRTCADKLFDRGNTVPSPVCSCNDRLTPEVTHERTLAAKARCTIGPGSCHDCAMTCPHGNQVRDDNGQLHPCGSDVFDLAGNILLCGECRQGWGEQ